MTPALEATLAAGFEVQIRYTNRKPVAGVPWQFEPTLVELARWADTLVVVTAGGAATRETRQAMEALTVVNLRAFYAGGAVQVSALE